MLEYQPRVLENGFIKMPYLSVSPVGVTLYNRIFTELGTDVNFQRSEIPTIKAEKGEISKKGQRALKKAVYWFLYSVHPEIVTKSRHKNKISFLTLTLPSKQVHSDKEIKEKALNQFITELRQKYNVKKYIWKAEKQDNFNLHFHLLTDVFLPVKEVKQIWNRIINKMGYVYEYSKKMNALTWPEYWTMRAKEYKPKYESKEKFINRIRKAYKKGVQTSWREPNSIDIESLKGVNHIAAYISKYMTKGHKGKNKDKMSVQGRIWYSSQSVSKMKNLQIEVYNDEITEFSQMSEKYLKKDKVYETDYSYTVSVAIDLLSLAGFQHIPNLFYDYCKEIFQEVKKDVQVIKQTVIQEVKIYKEQIKEIKKEFKQTQMILQI